MIYLFGSVSILLIGLMAALVAIKTQRYCIYGKATLGYLGIFVMFFSFMRFSVSFEMFDRETAGVITGLASIGFFIGMFEIVGLHALQHLCKLKGRNSYGRE